MIIFPIPKSFVVLLVASKSPLWPYCEVSHFSQQPFSSSPSWTALKSFWKLLGTWLHLLQHRQPPYLTAILILFVRSIRSARDHHQLPQAQRSRLVFVMGRLHLLGQQLVPPRHPRLPLPANQHNGVFPRARKVLSALISDS